MKLLLDEHYSPTVAEQLRDRGIDAIPVAERIEIARAALRGTADEELLRWARQENRVLVTENVRDFMPLHRMVLERAETHAGIIFTPPRRYPRRTDAIGLLVGALADFTLAGPDLTRDVAWL